MSSESEDNETYGDDGLSEPARKVRPMRIGRSIFDGVDDSDEGEIMMDDTEEDSDDEEMELESGEESAGEFGEESSSEYGEEA